MNPYRKLAETSRITEKDLQDLGVQMDPGEMRAFLDNHDRQTDSDLPVLWGEDADQAEAAGQNFVPGDGFTAQERQARRDHEGFLADFKRDHPDVPDMDSDPEEWDRFMNGDGRKPIKALMEVDPNDGLRTFRPGIFGQVQNAYTRVRARGMEK